MGPNNDNEELLQSWKEISSYLNCDRRTCLRWEKQHGLPIHRISDSPKSPVYAYKHEIDAWLKQGVTRGSRNENQKKKKFNKFLYLFPMLGVVVIVWIGIHIFSAKSDPADFSIQNSELVILDDAGKELWHFDTGIENLVAEEAYREHFQYRKVNNGEVNLPHLIIGDLDGNDMNEVLFSTQTQTEYGEGILYCFDHKGEKLWEFAAGREMKYGFDMISSDFRIRGFEICDLDDDGKSEIIVLAKHKPLFPCQLAILDNNGTRIGEYWNSGYLIDMAVLDLGNDGKKEIILSGCNNEYGNACLVVFEYDNIRGGSPQKNNSYICKNLEKGSQKYYVLFPRTEIDRLQSPVEAIYQINVLKNHRLQLRTRHSQILYELNYYLEVENVHLSHGFEQSYKIALKNGDVSSRIIKDDYEKELAKKLLYYDGKEWSPRPVATEY